ncbi:MAG: hypothetical protein JW749_08725, partial [Sedimentisphaerales bacterium]|nr:hypothetical protein [Sedimentisphaerales bacterium]
MIKKLILALVMLSLFTGLCDAAYTEVMGDLHGTSWILYGTVKASASKVCSVSANTFCTVGFVNDTVTFTDEDGFILYGTYYYDTKGRLDINQQFIYDLFNDFSDDALDEAGIHVLSRVIEDISTKSKIKVSYKGDTNKRPSHCGIHIVKLTFIIFLHVLDSSYFGTAVGDSFAIINSQFSIPSSDLCLPSSSIVHQVSSIEANLLNELLKLSHPLPILANSAKGRSANKYYTLHIAEPT